MPFPQLRETGWPWLAITDEERSTGRPWTVNWPTMADRERSIHLVYIKKHLFSWTVVLILAQLREWHTPCFLRSMNHNMGALKDLNSDGNINTGAQSIKKQRWDLLCNWASQMAAHDSKIVGKAREDLADIADFFSFFYLNLLKLFVHVFLWKAPRHHITQMTPETKGEFYKSLLELNVYIHVQLGWCEAASDSMLESWREACVRVCEAKGNSQ